MAQNEGAAWRKFLKPLITGAAVLMGAVGGYFEYLQRQDTSMCKERMTAFEMRMDAVEKHDIFQDSRSDKFTEDIDNFKVLLSDIRSDVSFIRGKMEGGSKGAWRF
jgi:hypothetical protein